MTVLYVQTSGVLTTINASFTPIPGLSLALPEGVQDQVLVILNLPNPYAEGNNFPGGTLGIAVNGKTLPAIASFTYGVQVPVSANRMPTTLAVAVPLTTTPQTVQGMWQSVRGSKVIIDSPSSLSVVF
jgi:mannose-binding lectin